MNAVINVFAWNPLSVSLIISLGEMPQMREMLGTVGAIKAQLSEGLKVWNSALQKSCMNSLALWQ